VKGFFLMPLFEPALAERKKIRFPFDQDEFIYSQNVWKRAFKGFYTNFLAFLLIALLWYAAATFVIHLKGVPFPTPLATFHRLWEFFQGMPLYEKGIEVHLMSSLFRWGAGYGLAIALGLLLGMALGASPVFHGIIMPAVYVFQLVPGLAWLPIALLIFGLGESATIFMIFMTALPPIVINTSGGIMGVPSIYRHAAEMMGLRRGRVFFSVLMPASMISIINGLRIGFANGWRVLIAAEMIVGMSVGLGYSLIQSRWSLDYEAALACIVIICIFGLFIEKIVFAVIEKQITERLGISKRH
jgi:ABC-type nitrate/sulfonate/bicarbonate transport system permease component